MPSRQTRKKFAKKRHRSLPGQKVLHQSFLKRYKQNSEFESDSERYFSADSDSENTMAASLLTVEMTSTKFHKSDLEEVASHLVEQFKMQLYSDMASEIKRAICENWLSYVQKCKLCEMRTLT
ncbi:hypothetical protein DPMN_042494 [Dreissena polymorpha]|uniref:Uncharacterized protein n=1 Tax=Dreissena polymorpha TaxID=45954 RepID=A0A9D4D251_DREPO|nr:hypothetical protein DPMN_042494 [Dreissena polymorpha]